MVYLFNNFNISFLYRGVKQTSNLRTSKFIFEFEFGILNFDIRVKFALEQMFTQSVCEWDAMSLFFAGSWCPPLHQPIAVAYGDAVSVWLPLPLPPHTSSVAAFTLHRNIEVYTHAHATAAFNKQRRSATVIRSFDSVNGVMASRWQDAAVTADALPNKEQLVHPDHPCCTTTTAESALTMA